MTLTDTLQHWLQGEINATVSGHDSRITRLEQNTFVQPELNVGLLKRIEYLDGYTSGLCQRIDHLEQRIEALAHVIDRQAQLIEDQRAAFKELHGRIDYVDIKTLNEAHNQLAHKVQAMLVPETLCADDLLDKVCDSENWSDAVAECYSDSAFVDAVNDVVSGHELKGMVRGIINDLRFDVSVR